MKDVGLKQIRLSGCHSCYIHLIENLLSGVRKSRNVNNSMKAKCPFCIDGCHKCDDTGKVDVKFADGSLWTRTCTICGFENGGRIQKGDKEPTEPSGRCVVCGAPTKWVMIGNMNEILGDTDEIPTQARA